MCQKCRADEKARKLSEEKNGKRIRTRGRAATWQGYRVEGDGRRNYVSYCDEHFHWWNRRRLEEINDHDSGDSNTQAVGVG